MANLDQLPSTGATLVLGPLQLQKGSGSPLSIMAFVPYIRLLRSVLATQAAPCTSRIFTA